MAEFAAPAASATPAAPATPSAPAESSSLGLKGLPVPIPITKVTEPLDPQNQTIPGDISIDESGRLLKTYFAYKGIIQDIIDIFDDWITNKLKSFMKSRVVRISRDRTLHFETIIIKPPTYSIKTESFNLLPAVARVRKESYSGTMICDLVIKDKNGREISRKNTPLGKIPIMLGSVLCHLRGKTETELIQMGECPTDPFGYFIISGVEYTLVTQEKLRVNKFIIFDKDFKGNVTCRITIYRPYVGTTVFYLYKTDASAINIKFTKLDIPVLSVYSVFKMSLDDSLNMILSFINSDRNKERAKYILQATINEYYKTNVSEIKREDILKELFPNMEGMKLELRLQSLSLMTAKYLEFLIGHRRIDDRDHWANKRLESAGRLMEQLFVGIINKIFIPFLEKEIADKNLSDINDISNIIQSNFNIITDEFRHSFNSKLWGVKNSKKAKESVVEQLKREGAVSTYSQLLKINTPTSQQTKQANIRMVQMSQLGYIDPVETPEGKKCGLVKHRAITCRYTVEREDISIIRYIQDFEGIDSVYETSKPDDFETEDNPFRTSQVSETGTRIFETKAFEAGDLEAEIADEASVVKASASKASTANASTTKASDTKATAVKASAVKASAVKASAVKASTANASAVDVSDTKSTASKASIANASTANASTAKASTANASAVDASDTKSTASKASTAKASTSKASTANASASNASASNASDTKSTASKASTSNASAANTFESKASTKASEACKSSIISKSSIPRVKDTYVVVNGKFICWSSSGESLYQHLLKLRRSGAIHFETSIVFDRKDKGLYLYTTGSRPIWPLLIVNQETNKLYLHEALEARAARETRGKRETQGKQETLDVNLDDFVDLLRHGIVEYIDPWEQDYITIAQSIEDFKQYSADLERIRSQMLLATNPDEAKVLELSYQRLLKKRYTHCQLDPIAILGSSSSLMPLANFNQGPRLSYFCSMVKQALTQYHSNHQLRFDPTIKVLSWPARPIFEGQMSRLFNLDKVPRGENVLCAFMAYTGYNQEDSLIFNKASIDEGKFMYTVYFRYYVALKNVRDLTEKFGIVSDPEEQKNQVNLDENGIVKLGTHVKPEDILVRKIRNYQGTRTIDDLRVLKYHEGIVDQIIKCRNAENAECVYIKIRDVRKPEIGDKFASRYAQKATIGIILPREDMPFNEETGVTPDVIINPHCIISRMTMGKLLEMLASKTTLLTGEYVNATAFRKFDYTEFQRILKQYGYDEYGLETLRSGITGELIKTKIFIGPCFYQATRHQVKDKIQMRARGSIKAITHQPISGRNKGGGLRFGEYEKDNLISHGASSILQERMLYASDIFQTVFCTNCGEIAISSLIDEINICKVCGQNARFGRCSIPYAFKTLLHYLAATGISLRFKFRNTDFSESSRLSKTSKPSLAPSALSIPPEKQKQSID